MSTEAYRCPADKDITGMPQLATRRVQFELREACHNAIARTSIVAPFLVFILLCSAAAQDQPGRAPSNDAAKELVRRVVANELKSEQQDHSHWMFRLDTRKPNGQEEVDEVVESKDGDLKRPLLINGRELTSEQRQNADRRLQQLMHNPGALRKTRVNEDQDTTRSQRLLKMLPDAFAFNYGQRRGDLVQLNFSPNPDFKPSTHEGEVFHAMQGSLWVDAKQNRLEEISGHLIREVKFGGGVLGHLDQGGTFEVKQAPVAPGYWELTLLNVHMKGKAFFFKTIAVQQQYQRSDFKQIPDDLTVTRAAEMLEKQGTSSEARAQQEPSKDN
jgi:hypothetical protein